MKKEGFINIVNSTEKHDEFTVFSREGSKDIYTSLAAAILTGKMKYGDRYITSIKIEWEEK